jgi:hypothetical protein
VAPRQRVQHGDQLRRSHRDWRKNAEARRTQGENERVRGAPERTQGAGGDGR